MTTLIDNFNRPDEDPIAGNWVTALGTGLRINTLQVNGSSGITISIYNGLQFTDDQEAEVVIAVSDNFNNVGPAVRFDTTGNGYVLRYSPSGDDLVLLNYVDGTQSTIGNYYNVGISNGDSLKLGVVGNELTPYVNGVAAGPATIDNTHTSGTVGLFYQNGNGNGSKLDDFSAAGMIVQSNVLTVGTNNEVTDGDQGVIVTFENFDPIPNQASLKVGTDRISVNSSIDGSNNFIVDLPDITDITTSRLGLPVSSGTYQNELELSNGTQIGSLNIIRNLRPEYDVVEVVDAVATEGSWAEGRTGGAPLNGSQFVYENKENTITTPSLIVSTDADFLRGWLWDVDTGFWEAVTIDFRRVPVITVSGQPTTTINQGDTTPTFTASTDDGSPVVVSGDTIDTNTPDTYVVTFNSSNAAGDALEVTRTVIVEAVADVTPPVITIIGDGTVTITEGDTYTDAGATAADNVDGDITGNIFTVNPVNTNTPGTYIVTYNVQDSSNNLAAQVTRTVIVESAPDVTIPVITINGDVSVTINEGDTYTDAGATALDDTDGDLTGDIVVVNPVDENTVGTYTITYNVSDSSENAAVEVTRTVNVQAVDGVAPVITLLGNATVTINQGDTYVDAGATALDETDGDITGDIVVVNPVNENVPASYTITYNVSDAVSNPASEVTRTVIVEAVVDTTPPVITLLGSPSVNITLGDVYTDAGATAFDNVDGDLTANIVTVNPVNINAVGDYSITYNVSDAAGNAAQEVTRTVSVQAQADTTAPVIAVSGPAYQNVDYGTSQPQFTSSTDDGSAIIFNNAGYNSRVPGTYIFTFNATDAAGNQATEVTRTVRVKSQVIPPPPPSPKVKYAVAPPASIGINSKILG